MYNADLTTVEYKEYAATHIQCVRARLDGSPDVEQLEFTESVEFNAAVVAAEKYVPPVS